MNSHVYPLFMVLTSATLMPGCFFFDALFYESSAQESYDYDYGYGYDDSSYGYGYGDSSGAVGAFHSAIEVSQASVGGDFGTPSDALPATVQGSSEGAWIGLDILSETDDEALMAMVDVWGGLESIPTGSVQTYDRYADGSEGHVSVVGCVGPRPYEWTRDQTAELVEVRATANPDDPTLRTYRFRAHFDAMQYDETSRAAIITGSFVAP